MDLIKTSLRTFTFLKNAEHFNINYSIICYLEKEIGDIPVLQKLFAIYNRYFEDEDILYKRLRTLRETKSLKELDFLRDKLTISLRRSVSAALCSENPEKKKAGEYLHLILNDYKYIERKPYTENTALVQNMLQDLYLAENLPYIRQLRLENLLVELKKYNDDFRLLYDERSVKKEGYRQEGTLKLIRIKVDKALRKLIDTINVLYAANELEANNEARGARLREIIDTLNSFIEQAEDVYHRRAKKED